MRKLADFTLDWLRIFEGRQQGAPASGSSQVKAVIIRDEIHSQAQVSKASRPPHLHTREAGRSGQAVNEWGAEDRGQQAALSLSAADSCQQNALRPKGSPCAGRSRSFWGSQN